MPIFASLPGYQGPEPYGYRETQARMDLVEQYVPTEVQHSVVTGLINLATKRNPYVFVGTLVAHGVYHLYNTWTSSPEQGVIVSTGGGRHNIDEVSTAGDNTFDDVLQWVGTEVVPGVSRGDVVIAGVSYARRSWIVRQKRLRGRCTSRNWRGKQCKLYRGHSTLAASQLGDHDY